MFGLWNKKRPVIHQWWHAVLLDFESSTGEFYSEIESDLKKRELMGLELSRVEYAEGGILSAKRTYLRMRRERLIFDVCSAPFGTSWLFSCRFAEVRVSLRVWELVVMLLFLVAFWFSYAQLFGVVTGSIVFGATLLGLVLAMLCAVPFGLHDMDAALLQLPCIGTLYELYLRPDTYYRQDTRVAYTRIVNSIVRQRVQEIAKAHGVEDVQFVDLDVPEETPPLLDRMIERFRRAKNGV
jgi:hypothetical protein